jgi:protein SCO1/2
MKRIMPFSEVRVLLLLVVTLLVIFVYNLLSNPAKGPTEYPGVTFITQDDEEFSPASIKLKYTIAGFFFTSCPTICPRMVEQMKRVQASIKKSSNYLILFYSINPEVDSPERLSEYGRRHSIDSKRWLLLNGTKKDIEIMSSFYALRGEQDKNDPTAFIHDGQFLLTNNHTGVTTRYIGTDSISVEILIKDIHSDL